jgi:hypothetical protein
MSSKSKAEEAFDALPEWKRLSLAKDVFLNLEYDADGNPGSEWSSDTTQALGDLFATYGVKFTQPGELDTDELDIESSASFQHYIDTGRYLRKGEAIDATEGDSDETPSAGR